MGDGRMTDDYLAATLAHSDPRPYQPLECPEFAGIGCHQPCEERWAMISGMLDLSRPGKALDLGCHTGWFCRRFSLAGWECTGVDSSEYYLDVAREMSDGYAGDPLPKYVLADLYDWPVPEADAALCLSVLMYLFRQPEKAWGFLRRVSDACPVLFADWGGMYADTLPEGLAGLIVAETSYTSFELLGHTDLEGRPFHVFRR